VTDFVGAVARGLLRCNCAAEAVEFATSNQQVIRLDFNGHIAVSLDPAQLQQFLTGAISLVPLTIKEHVTRGTSTVEDLGDVSLNILLDVDRLLESILKGNSFPADQVMNFHLTVESPELFPGKKLRSKNPASLSGRLNRFPPQGDLYQLADPVELEDTDNPGDVLARINTFPVRVTHQ
jgi:hypothetical protein